LDGEDIIHVKGNKNNNIISVAHPYIA